MKEDAPSNIQFIVVTFTEFQLEMSALKMDREIESPSRVDGMENMYAMSVTFETSHLLISALNADPTQLLQEAQ